MFNRLDHIAIVVRNTDNALSFYRDTLGLPVLLSEEMPDSRVRLTHLDLGNVQLQLVEPLTPDHPLQEHLRKHGEGLHHLCLHVDHVPQTVAALPGKGMKPRDPNMHSAPHGKEAAFIHPDTTRGVLWELTGEKAVS